MHSYTTNALNKIVTSVVPAGTVTVCAPPPGTIMSGAVCANASTASSTVARKNSRLAATLQPASAAWICFSSAGASLLGELCATTNGVATEVVESARARSSALPRVQPTLTWPSMLALVRTYTHPAVVAVLWT